MNPIAEVKQIVAKIEELHDDVEFLKDIVHAVVRVVLDHEAKKEARNATSHTA